MAKLKDFDAYFAEVEKEPIQFKIKGETFELPDSLPAFVMFKVMRMYSNKGKEADVDQSEAIELMEQVFGKETNDRLLKTGIGFDQYQEILQWAMEELSGQEKNKQPAKETAAQEATK